jgi:hypothetical protein
LGSGTVWSIGYGNSKKISFRKVFVTLLENYPSATSAVICLVSIGREVCIAKKTQIVLSQSEVLSQSLRNFPFVYAFIFSDHHQQRVMLYLRKVGIFVCLLLFFASQALGQDEFVSGHRAMPNQCVISVVSPRSQSSFFQAINVNLGLVRRDVDSAGNFINSQPITAAVFARQPLENLN